MKKRYSNFKDLKNDFGIILESRHIIDILDYSDKSFDFYYEKVNTAKTSEALGKILDEYFSENFDSVNQEAYVFYTLKTIYSGQLQNRLAETVEHCKSFLKDSQYKRYEVRTTEDKKDVEIIREDAQQLIGKEKKYPDKEKKKMLNILNNIPFNILFGANTYNDILEFCNDFTLAVFLRRSIIVNIMERKRELSAEDKLNILNGNWDEEEVNTAIEELKDVIETDPDYNTYFKDIVHYMKEYPDEFEFNKVLLISAYRLNRALENPRLDRDTNKLFTTFLIECIKNINSKVNNTVIEANNSEGKTTYSYKNLLTASNRITANGYYVSKEREERIWDIITDDPQMLMSIDPEELKVIEFKNEDYDWLIREGGLLAYMLENKLMPNSAYKRNLHAGNIVQSDLIDLAISKIIKPAEVKIYISKIDKIEQETFEYIVENDIFSPEEQLNLFLEGKVDFEQIEQLPQEKQTLIGKSLSTKDLVTTFQEKDNDEESKNRYIKYVQAFRNLVLKGNENIEDIESEIIEQFGDKIDDDILEELYNSYLISFNTLLDWTGPTFVSKMMARTEIRPEDAKRLCYEGNFETLFEALSDNTISRSKKIGIFRTSFANIDYDSMTEEQRLSFKYAISHCLRLINLLDIKNTNIGYGERSIGDNHEENVENDKKYNEYTSDPLQRWDLIDLMGRYSYEMLDQGLAIFKFPEYKGGTIILEKMYRKDQPEYGRATKILSMTIEEFDSIKGDLIVNEDIPPFMLDMHPLTRYNYRNIIHSPSWGQQLADYFEYNSESQRTSEEIAKIDKKIQSILNSRELRV